MYIAVEGCIGSGKTMVAKGLATVAGSKLILEDFAAHPLLSKFYSDPMRYAVETELIFLVMHYHQLRECETDVTIITDFTLYKDLLFSKVNLSNASDLSAFEELYRHLSEQISKPVVTIFLSASDELILKRISGRQRVIESNVDPAYFRKINDAYRKFFDAFDSPVLTVNMDETDFSIDSGLFVDLWGKVETVLRSHSLPTSTE